MRLTSKLPGGESASSDVDPRELRGRIADPALADATAFDDPLIAGVEGLLQIGVRHDLVGQGGAPTQNSHTHERLLSPD